MSEKNRQTRFFCVLASALAIISEGAVVVSSILTGSAIDLAGAGQLRRLLITCGLLLVLAILSNCIFIVSIWANLKYGLLRSRQMKLQLLLTLFRKPLFAFRRHDDAYYINLLSKDIDGIAERYEMNFSVEVKFGTLVLASVAAMLFMDIRLFAVAALFSFVPLLVTAFFEPKIQKETKTLSGCREASSRETIQLIQAHEMLKVNNADAGSLTENVNRFFERENKAAIKKETLQGVSYSAVDCVNTFGQLILLGVGGYLITKGRISAGQLVSATILTQYVCSGINNFLETYVERTAQKPICRKYEDALREEPQPQVESASDKAENVVVCYKQTTFSHGENEQPILQNKNLVFENGKSYAIIGESGIGKSTLVRLLLKYYDNYEGHIFLFGREVKTIPDRELYERVGILNQSEFILNDTLRNNIMLYRDAYGEDEYRDMLTRLRLDDLAQRLDDRKLGDFGEMVSGGERQRIALARVLLRKPALLILDEPTTGLDPENASIIEGVIHELKDTTRIVITHNCSELVLSRYDEIIRL